MEQEFLFYLLIGFAAQIVDGALGMAYGVTSSSLLLGMGLPPATISATVHAAECFSTGASALSHKAFGNIRPDLFKRLLVPGVAGAIIGSLVVSYFPADLIKPYIALYLMLMGVIIIVKAFREFPPRKVTTHLTPLGFFGGFFDSVGGGGWGPIVTTNLLVRGNDLRETVGSVSAVEFFVTFASSLTFFATIGFSHLHIIVPLALGGLLAAPLGAWLVKIIPVRPFMVAVGLLVVGLSLRTMIRAFN